MGNIFQFKQFSVDQNNCAMRINTDGVLLGALATAENPARILDIGTGTGVIALMLAQRYEKAAVFAVEIDSLAAKQAEKNFDNSPFSTRLTLTHSDVFQYQVRSPFDLIISNPPFYTNSLHNPDPRKKVAKHTDKDFFCNLLEFAQKNLQPLGLLQIIVPDDLLELLVEESDKNHLYLTHKLAIRSFAQSNVIRYILSFCPSKKTMILDEFVIYQEKSIHSEAYITLLKPYF
ncbi:MAG: tRNA1(Val) (adenine(37)-N6)-methyltransferase, partial [Sphingobacterium sp.]